jgi:hypothetical protein
MVSIPPLRILFLEVITQRLLPTNPNAPWEKFSNVFWKMKFVKGRQNPPIRIPDIEKMHILAPDLVFKYASSHLWNEAF